MEKMKAAVFHGKHDVRIEECDKPLITTGQLLIEIHACGICGTDIHIYEGDEGAAATVPPTILGHEFAGVVTQVGSGVSDYAVGDRVTIDPNVLCNNCYYCRNGVGHFCEKMIGIGTTTNGGFAEYVAVPSTQAYKLADDVSFAEGAMAEPLACCLHGIDLCKIKPGMRVTVIGGGMIGLLMLQLARLSGAAELTLIEPVKEKREMAKKLGADITINPYETKSPAESADVVIECVGLKETMQEAIRIAGKGATVMLFGLTAPDDEIALKPFDLFRKEVTLKSSFINPYTMERAVSLINNRKIDVSIMIHAEIPLSCLQEVLSNPEKRKQGKCIVNPLAR